MENMLQILSTTITPAQSMRLFTSRKTPKRSWPEHYLYLVAVGEAVGGGADSLVLDNIVHYASAEVRTILMSKYDQNRVDYLRHAEELCHFAQAVEMEARSGKAFGNDSVSHVSESKSETRRCHNCGEVGHLRSASTTTKSQKADFTLAVSGVPDASCENWILDSGSSRHLVNDSSLLENREAVSDVCLQAGGKGLHVTQKGSVLLHVVSDGVSKTVRLANVHYVANLSRNIISYGILEEKGCELGYVRGRRVLRYMKTGETMFDVGRVNKVLTLNVRVERPTCSIGDVVMAVLEESEGELSEGSNVQQGTLMHFHTRFEHLNYGTIERMAKDPASSGIVPTDHRRANCLTCAQGKQTRNSQSQRDSGDHAPIDRVSGVICSDLKGPMTPRDRLGNRYLVNFTDHKSNYVRVFLARTKDATARKFEHFLIFFEKRFECRIHVLRTDVGGEYQTLDPFCKKTGVARQISEANNQASNGKAERMHRTIMNMARSMIFCLWFTVVVLG